MKIAIVGAGFTGLSAAYNLAKNNHQVLLFEKDKDLGGLAAGYKEPGWQWSLEKHYHHWFTNDKNALLLAKEINYQVITKNPKTSVYIDGHIYRLDSPKDVLTFPLLDIIDKLRMAAVLGFLRYDPFWKPLEKIKAEDFLKATMGKNAYYKLWEPQLKNKFGEFADQISLAWFWARIKKRTPSLAYPKEGFLEFANALVQRIEFLGGKIFYNTSVENVEELTKKFDKVIVTLPSFSFLRIAPQLPQDYKLRLQKLKGLGAINLILRLKEPFLNDGTYWLSICDKNSPVMAIVEHTNFMDKKYYNDEHVIYLGNYLPENHPFMKMSKDELFKIYTPFLKKINPTHQQSLISFQLFKSSFAQPIIPTNYSKIIPPFETPIKNVYLANMQQVYPWDRGTNYAIELGEKIAKIATES